MAAPGGPSLGGASYARKASDIDLRKDLEPVVYACISCRAPSDKSILRLPRALDRTEAGLCASGNFSSDSRARARDIDKLDFESKPLQYSHLANITPLGRFNYSSCIVVKIVMVASCERARRLISQPFRAILRDVGQFVRVSLRARACNSVRAFVLGALYLRA